MTIFEIAEALRNQRISSLEITQTYINKAYENKHLNAYISINEEIALDQAKQADQHIKKGQFGPLTGVPIAHKDLFCTRGQLTSCASKSLSNFIAPYDATLVEKLNQAGMVTLGKTNMDEFAMGSSNENSIYGSAKNPWNTAHVPGGSSGGSAVVVAADLAPIATGSDTGGSVRQPAAYCGITGIKPSYGRVSRYGMVAFASSLDQAGVLAQDARDAALVLQHMAGFDPKDSTSIDAPVEDYVGALETKIDSLTIGVPKEFFDASLNSDIAKAIDEAIDVYKRLGAKIVDISLPNVHAGIPCYYVIAPAEASSNLSRFDGVRYGHRSQQVDDLQSLYENSRVEGFGDEVKRRIMMGAYVLSSGYYDAYYMKALKLRRLIANDYQQAFTQCDVILGPTTPTTAFKIGSNQNDPVSMYLNDIYTTSINLTGLPGISIPCGFDENKLPIGLQLIGQYLGEAQLLNQAHQFQQATDWHRKKPQGF